MKFIQIQQVWRMAVISISKVYKSAVHWRLCVYDSTWNLINHPFNLSEFMSLGVTNFTTNNIFQTTDDNTWKQRTNLGIGEKFFGTIGVPVPKQIFTKSTQSRLYVTVDWQLPSVHNSHVHTRLRHDTDCTCHTLTMQENQENVNDNVFIYKRIICETPLICSVHHYHANINVLVFGFVDRIRKAIQGGWTSNSKTSAAIRAESVPRYV